MTGLRVAVVAAIALGLAAAWVILGDTDTARTVNLPPSEAVERLEFDALEASESGAEALKVEMSDAPAVLEAVGRGRLILSRAGECGEVPGVVMALRNLASGKTRRTFGRFSKWEWRDLRSGDYEVSLDPQFADRWSCEPQVLHVGRDERVSATVELRSLTRIAGWISDGFAPATVLKDVVLYARAYREGHWADGMGCRTPVTLSPSGSFCIEGWELASSGANRLRIRASARGYEDVWTSTFAIENGAAFTLADVDIRMYLPTTVTGTVVDDAGSPMPGVNVVAGREGEDSPFALTDTDANGRYELSFGTELRGRLAVTGLTFPTERSELLTVARGQSREVDFVVRPYRGVVKGRVTVRGMPAVGWLVSVVARESDRSSGMAGMQPARLGGWMFASRHAELGGSTVGPRVVGRATTDANGEFTCTGVSFGSHIALVYLPDYRRLMATRRFDVGHDGQAFLAVDVKEDPDSDVLVSAQITSDIDGSFIGFLYEAKRPSRIDHAAFEDGRATLRSPVRGPVLLVVKGTTEAGSVLSVIPLDLSSGSSPPTVSVNPLTTTLRVFPSEANSDGWWSLAAATGDPMVDDYFNRGPPRLSWQLKREAVIHGLPHGHYILRRRDEQAAEVTVVVGAATAEVTAP